MSPRFFTKNIFLMKFFFRGYCSDRISAGHVGGLLTTLPWESLSAVSHTEETRAWKRRDSQASPEHLGLATPAAILTACELLESIFFV